MDPQQRLALEVVYECLENSGAVQWRERNIGTYVGIFGEVGFYLGIWENGRLILGCRIGQTW